jgi:hypothetical protein
MEIEDDDENQTLFANGLQMARHYRRRETKLRKARFDLLSNPAFPAP